MSKNDNTYSYIEFFVYYYFRIESNLNSLFATIRLEEESIRFVRLKFTILRGNQFKLLQDSPGTPRALKWITLT